MPLPKKVGVAVLFLVSLVADAIAVARIFFAVHQQATLDTWDLYWQGISGIVELGIGQVCISIPVIRPLITKYYDQVKSWTPSSSKRLRSYGSRKQASISLPLSSKESSETMPTNFEVGKQFPEHSAFAGIASIRPPHGELDGIAVVHTVEQDSKNGMQHTTWALGDGNV